MLPKLQFARFRPGRRFRAHVLIACLYISPACLLRAAESTQPSLSPKIFEASDEAEMALKTFRPASGLKVDLFAAEPLVVNPVAFCLDERGNAYVVETFRRLAGVLNIEGRVDWEEPAIVKLLGAEVVADYMLTGDLACRTFEENLAFLQRHFGARAASLSGLSERVRLITPGPDGKASRSSVFAEGFDRMGDGVAAGVLARRGKVWFACIPDLWELGAPKEPGATAERKSLQHGYGVHVGTGSHSLHGLKIGPDGRLYFSMGDRGASVLAWDGSQADNPDSGAVFRCNLDGSSIELFATGLRNPQGLAFDQFGNLFTGDNNSDGGDPSRWVYVVEGGDSGWRAGYQYIERPSDADTLTHPPQSRGVWLNEGHCLPRFDGQAAFLVPPVANIASGPSGVAFYPGVGLPGKYDNHFFLVDFKGAAANSLIHSFANQPKGAGFELVDRDVLISNVLPTDVVFGPDCRVYFSDWVNGWTPPGKGRLYRVFDEKLAQTVLALETKSLIAEGMGHRSQSELVKLLSHPDQRVRQEAQFALADARAVTALRDGLRQTENRMARTHAVWALGQIADPNALESLLPLLADQDAEVAAQAAKVLGEARFSGASRGLLALIANSQNPRGQFFAALGLGKIGKKEAIPAIMEMLRANADLDPFLRHAGVMALVWIKNLPAIFAAAKDESPSVRMASLLALRRLERPEIALFLRDSEPRIVVEAARAINDSSLALPDLAEMIGQTNRWTSFPDGSNGNTDLLTPLLRRVINANFRIGDAQNARALAQFAADNATPEAARFEALQQLGHWDKPSSRDQITGLYCPLPSRDSRIAGEMIRSVISNLLGPGPTSVRVVAAKLAGQYSIESAQPLLLGLARDKRVPSRVRVESLKALAGFQNNGEIATAIDVAAADPDEKLRVEASRLRARLRMSGLAAKLAGILDNGSVAEQQNALTELGALKDNDADFLLGGWLDRLLARKVKPELQLDLLEAAGTRNSPHLQEKLAQFESSLAKNDDLARYRGTLFGGDAEEGKKIFFEKPEAACLRCHKIGNEGNEVGPILNGVGSRLSRENILESIIHPNKQIATGFETTIVQLKDGTAPAGIVKSETGNELILNSPESGLVKILKTDILDRQRGLSGMPEGLIEILPKRDLRNLVEFLAGQH